MHTHTLEDDRRKRHATRVKDPSLYFHVCFFVAACINSRLQLDSMKNGVAQKQTKPFGVLRFQPMLHVL